MSEFEPVWLNPFTGGFIVLPLDVWDRIGRFTVGSERQTEAGGIFIGCYRGPHMEIVDATEPMSSDSRAQFSFFRRDAGHRVRARESWIESGRTQTMVGEWHSHPTSYPVPSTVDTGSWRQLTSKNSRPLFFLILGESGHWPGLARKTTSGLEIRRTLPLFGS